MASVVSSTLLARRRLIRNVKPLDTPMPDNTHDTVCKKVEAIFTELADERTARLGEPGAQATRDTLASALSADYAPDTARDIAFHLVDWHTDAAFMMAVHLFPERFTPEELVAGADMLLIHAPNHLAAAAKLAGHPIQDVFEIGVPDDTDPNAYHPILNQKPQA